MQVDYGNHRAAMGGDLAAQPAEGQQPQQQGQPQEGQQDAGDEVRLSRAEHQRLLAVQTEAARLRHAETLREQMTPRSESQRLEALEARYRNATMRSAIGDALGGIPFVSDQAREDARLLLERDTELREVDGELVAYHRGVGIPLAQVSRDTIVRRFAHAVRAEHRGGGTTINRDRPDPEPFTVPENYPTPGHRLLAMVEASGKPKVRPAFGGDLRAD